MNGLDLVLPGESSLHDAARRALRRHATTAMEAFVRQLRDSSTTFMRGVPAEQLEAAGLIRCCTEIRRQIEIRAVVDGDRAAYHLFLLPEAHDENDAPQIRVPFETYVKALVDMLLAGVVAAVERVMPHIRTIADCGPEVITYAMLFDAIHPAQSVNDQLA